MTTATIRTTRTKKTKVPLRQSSADPDPTETGKTKARHAIEFELLKSLITPYWAIKSELLHLLTSSCTLPSWKDIELYCLHWTVIDCFKATHILYCTFPDDRIWKVCACEERENNIRLYFCRHRMACEKWESRFEIHVNWFEVSLILIL